MYLPTKPDQATASSPRPLLAQGLLGSGNHLLAALKPADLMPLVAHMREINLVRGMVIADIDAPIEHVYFPDSGMVSLLTVMPDREAVETATIGAEGSIGIMAGLGSRRAVSRALVQLSGRATRIAAEPFAAAVAQSGALQRLIVHYSDSLMVQLQQSVACATLHTVEARLARWLLQACDRTGSDMLPLTQEFLSQALGVRRTTITLVAQLMQNAGMIVYRRGMIRIRDMRALEQRACTCYGMMRARMDRVMQDV